MIDPNLITTTRVGELPIAALSGTSKIPHEVGTDLKQATIQELIDLITPLVNAIQFQVIELDVTQQYIIDNFDATGLGINLMDGYAICNGNNGTKNRDGRTGIAYGTNYSFIGFTGGSSTHTLLEGEMPIHAHVINEVYNENTTGTKVGSGGGTIEAVGTQNTSTTGGNLPHNNMQPYIVTLTVMKL